LNSLDSSFEVIARVDTDDYYFHDVGSDWWITGEGHGVEAGFAGAEFCLVLGSHLFNGVLCILWDTILGSSGEKD
jgi:hypothetical protein